MRLFTLGGLNATLEGIEQDWVRSQPIRAGLLIYLAVEREVSRDSLCALMWPEIGDASAGHRLSQSIYSLRQYLPPESIDTRGRHVIAGASLQCDAAEFEHAVAQDNFELAMSVYRGPFLDGMHLVGTNEFESWCDAKRARYARLFRKACRAVVEQRSGSNDLEGTMRAADSWVEVDPMDDEARHRLIECLVATGNRIEALSQYEAYVHLLEAEGLKPLDETRELVKRIQSQASSLPRLARTAVPDQHPRRLGADVDSRLETELAPTFEIIRLLGAGNVAHVYLARDTTLQRLVAIKVLRSELAIDKTSRARFQREARSAAKLSHPNIAAVYSVGSLRDGTPYLVMEYIAGRNLADTLAAERALTVADTYQVLEQVAAALSAAHARGLIHRDLKPANIVWTRDTGRAVLMDFGLVAVVETGTQEIQRLTAAGEILGDPRYSSPEQLLGQAVTVATDIFSLGVLGYELLTQRVPYADSSGVRRLESQLHGTPAPLINQVPEVTPELSDLLYRCLNKVPTQRPTAIEIARRLRSTAGPAAASTHNSTSVAAPFRNHFGGFLQDLNRRGIPKVASWYIAASLVALQGADLILPTLRASSWFDMMVIIALGGFPLTLVFTWMFDVTRFGIDRTPATLIGSATGLQRLLGVLGLGLSVLLALLIGWWVLAS